MSENKSNSDNKLIKSEDLEKKLKDAHERFEINYDEFKRKKVVEIPCFRSTFLTSVPAGMIMGIFSYLITSKVKLASNIAMGSYLFVSAGYFINCRYEFNKKIEQNKELGDIMNLIIKYRGTELEQQFKQKYKEKMEEIDSKSKYV